MTQKSKQNITLECIKWLSVIFLIVTYLIVNCAYGDRYSPIARGIFLTIVILAMICVILSTALGQLTINMGTDAIAELRKVMWPTFRDGLNTTVVVIIVTVVMSLVLWGLDTILVYLISFGLRF